MPFSYFFFFQQPGFGRVYQRVAAAWADQLEQRPAGHERGPLHRQPLPRTLIPGLG